MSRLRFLVLTLFLFTGLQMAQAQSTAWWLTGSTQKITPEVPQPDDTTLSLHLHTARQEYAPFQIVIASENTDANLPSPVADFPGDYFTLQLYEEYFIDINYPPDEPEIFSLARLTTATTIPDGLRPLGDTLPAAHEGRVVIWADLYVKPETPAGDYTLTLTFGDAGTRTVTISVYPLDLGASAAMSVLVPVDYD
ncbi:MAG: hypothetical protein U0694_09870 [Anaerolineae bacterium]